MVVCQVLSEPEDREGKGIQELGVALQKTGLLTLLTQRIFGLFYREEERSRIRTRRRPCSFPVRLLGVLLRLPSSPKRL
jgi:hypothetical protein